MWLQRSRRATGRSTRGRRCRPGMFSVRDGDHPSSCFRTVKWSRVNDFQFPYPSDSCIHCYGNGHRGDHERIISIEDTPELIIPQPNHVRLFYSKGAQGLSGAGPKELLESCLRMRPDRILLQELRDGTAFYYVRNVNSGHPGSITTVHEVTEIHRRVLLAGGPALLFERPVDASGRVCDIPLLANLFGTLERIEWGFGLPAGGLPGLAEMLAELREPRSPQSLSDA